MAENGIPEMEEMNLEELADVNGGAKKNKAKADPMKKFEELRKEWNSMKFEKHGYTSHQLYAYMDQWQEQNYKPAARAYLKTKKNW